jgi:pantoate--beta-alanine ligase
VVLKLFQIVQPDVACFGQKDFQQQLVVRRMIRDLDLPVELVVCPTVREPDGLAMSSRNVFLSEAERRLARSLSESLELAGRMCAAGEPDLHRVREAMRKHLQSFPGVAVDYATVADAETLEEPTAVPADRAARRPLVALVAARVGQTRLIDNQLLEIR